MSGTSLREVLEPDATGSTAETYADIRAILGIPVVNLVYRHLAAEPGRLEAVWSALRGNLAHPATHSLASRLVRTAERVRPPVRPLERRQVLAAGVSASEWRRALATLAAYERANSLNLLATRALLDGAPGAGAGAPPSGGAASAPGEEILPMADPGSLGAHTRETLDAMSAAVAPRDGDRLAPSLFRHLASIPPLLELLWEAARDAFESASLRGGGATVHAEAVSLAQRLPLSVDPAGDAEVRAFLEWFVPTIGTMLVTGQVLGEAMRCPPPP